MSDTPLNIAVNGAVGRMGQRIVALTIADKELNLATSLEHATNPRLGEDAGEVCGAGTCGVAITS
ncbi:MAG TPA: 4-hydroxy-tetrahydrodipicolinate reductase, partial [Planctomycetes bacterium]|nr:4-hydroxy-tetrahydrodipicolinate reductase [Planctomycetota bacterium]